MYNITLICTMHKEIGKCNSKELYDIIEKENPEVIFEEFDISRTEDDYYKNGHYKYQKSCTLETVTIMKYLENNKIFHVPVDTYELPIDPPNFYTEISNACEEYDNIVRNNFILSCQNGFSYLNSDECSRLFEKILELEKNIVERLGKKNLIETYKLWRSVTDNRDKEMLKNIYDYSQNSNYTNAVFIIGAEHRKSILNKIEEFDFKYKIKINWKSWRIA